MESGSDDSSTVNLRHNPGDPYSLPFNDLKELKAFQRVNVKTCAVKKVQRTFNVASLAWWNEQAVREEIEVGPVKLMIGSSSADIPMEKQINVK
jgi:hypothetical protein